MGVQIPSRFHSEVSAQSSVRRIAQAFGRGVSQTCGTPRVPGRRGHLLPDHVHMMLSIPPKYAVSQVVGYIKGKSAIHLARVYGERNRGFIGQHFWARGYFVSTVGRDERVIRDYIKIQEKEDQRLDQLNLWR